MTAVTICALVLFAVYGLLELLFRWVNAVAVEEPEAPSLRTTVPAPLPVRERCLCGYGLSWEGRQVERPACPVCGERPAWQTLKFLDALDALKGETKGG